MAGGFNTYGYVDGNPLKLIDVYGLASNCVGCIEICNIIYKWEISDVDDVYKSVPECVFSDIDKTLCGAIKGVGGGAYTIRARKGLEICLDNCNKNECKKCND